jgi:hypothetical protein
MLFNNPELLKKILSMAEGTDEISEINLTPTEGRFANVDAEGTIKIKNTIKTIEVECKKFIQTNYRNFNNIEKMSNNFKNDFNDFFYKDIYRHITTLNKLSQTDDEALDERNNFIKLISTKGKIDKIKIDILYLAEKRYVYEPVTQTKFPKIPENVHQTKINPEKGITKLQKKQMKESSKNKESIHDEIAVVGVTDGCLTVNITRKLNEYLDAYSEMYGIERNKLHATTILKLVMTPYQGYNYDNIGVPFHWFNSVKMGKIIGYKLPNELRIKYEKIVQTKNAIKDAKKNAKK